MSPKSEYQKEKDAKREAMLTRQARQQSLETDFVVESPKTSEKIAPRTLKEKWINFWYHYKFIVFGSVFVCILAVWLLISVFLKSQPDATITIVATKAMDGAGIILNDTIAPIIPDNNDDGKVLLNTIALQMEGEKKASSLTAQQLEMNKAKFINILSSGDRFLYFLDEECYEAAVSFGVNFKPLDEYIDSDKLVGENHDRFLLKGSRISEELGLGTTLDDIYLCLVDFSQYDKKAQQKEKLKNAYAWDEALFKQMIEFEIT